jgi:hypothetical protein
MLKNKFFVGSARRGNLDAAEAKPTPRAFLRHYNRIVFRMNPYL